MASAFSFIVKSNDGSVELINVGATMTSGTIRGYFGEYGIMVTTGTNNYLFSKDYGVEILGYSTTPNSTVPTYKVGDMYNDFTVGVTPTFYIVPAPTREPKVYHKLSTRKKIQVESAVRDAEGNKIDSTYIKKSDIYKVGGIYMSQNPTSPAELFGGVWTQIMYKCLVGAVNSSGNKYSAGMTGGSETVTLTTSQIPSHNHGPGTLKGEYHMRDSDKGDGIWGAEAYSYSSHDTWSTGSAVKLTSGTTGSTGGGGSHDNMPPFYAVYIWIRVA